MTQERQVRLHRGSWAINEDNSCSRTANSLMLTTSSNREVRSVVKSGSESSLQRRKYDGSRKRIGAAIYMIL